MSTIEPKDWRKLASSYGLDPYEVIRVSERYDMYYNYTSKLDTELLELPRWYKWYRIEKLSEGHAMTQAPAEGCSVTEASPGQLPESPAASEQQFLELLQLYRAEN